MPYKGDKGDKNAARPPEGSLVETRCLIKGPKSAIVPFPGPRSGPKSRTSPGASQKAKSRVRASMNSPHSNRTYIHISKSTLARTTLSDEQWQNKWRCNQRPLVVVVNTRLLPPPVCQTCSSHLKILGSFSFQSSLLSNPPHSSDLLSSISHPNLSQTRLISHSHIIANSSITAKSFLNRVIKSSLSSST